jgi:hypothetical protein
LFTTPHALRSPTPSPSFPSHLSSTVQITTLFAQRSLILLSPHRNLIHLHSLRPIQQLSVPPQLCSSSPHLLLPHFDKVSKENKSSRHHVPLQQQPQ